MFANKATASIGDVASMEADNDVQFIDDGEDSNAEATKAAAQASPFVVPPPLFVPPLQDADDLDDADGPSFWSDVSADQAPWTTNVDTMEQAPDVVNKMNANTTLSFKEEYVKIIQPIMAKVQSLFAHFVWSCRPIATHPQASNIDIDKLLVISRRTGPLIDEQLKIDSANIKKHTEFQKMLDN